jgi:hypothetical protein
VTDEQAKKHLRRMLDSYSAGSILHLLADIHHELASDARRAGDDRAEEQCRLVADTLVVVGMGVDGVLPG